MRVTAFNIPPTAHLMVFSKREETNRQTDRQTDRHAGRQREPRTH